MDDGSRELARRPAGGAAGARLQAVALQLRPSPPTSAGGPGVELAQGAERARAEKAAEGAEAEAARLADPEVVLEPCGRMRARQTAPVLRVPAAYGRAAPAEPLGAARARSHSRK